ncbi:MAG: nucleoside hydrolase [Ruminococcaceae bacterium]|nr:nucleoside hydrolase [Oscillospiraceae bacterium]
MTNEERIKASELPKGKFDVVLDTDAYNEIDDQFAIAYLLSYPERAETKAIYAAPFHNGKSNGPRDGMEKSYDEIFKLLDLMKIKKDVFRGSVDYLPDESTPIDSPAARDLAERVRNYTKEKPLYIVAIGAITNVASAILLNPEVAERAVLVWLGGHALHYHDTNEFNMKQDVAAARVIYKSGIPYVQLPCFGVVSDFTVSKQELEYWFAGKNALSDYLAKNAIAEAESYASGRNWTRVIWDVTAVAWLFNDNDRFMCSRILDKAYLPEYNKKYETEPTGYPMRYVYYIKRDALMNDLINRVTK